MMTHTDDPSFHHHRFMIECLLPSKVIIKTEVIRQKDGTMVCLLRSDGVEVFDWSELATGNGILAEKALINERRFTLTAHSALDMAYVVATNHLLIIDDAFKLHVLNATDLKPVEWSHQRRFEANYLEPWRLIPHPSQPAFAMLAYENGINIYIGDNGSANMGPELVDLYQPHHIAISGLVIWCATFVQTTTAATATAQQSPSAVFAFCGFHKRKNEFVIKAFQLARNQTAVPVGRSLRLGAEISPLHLFAVGQETLVLVTRTSVIVLHLSDLSNSFPALNKIPCHEGAEFVAASLGNHQMLYVLNERGQVSRFRVAGSGGKNIQSVDTLLIENSPTFDSLAVVDPYHVFLTCHTGMNGVYQLADGDGQAKLLKLSQAFDNAAPISDAVATADGKRLLMASGWYTSGTLQQMTRGLPFETVADFGAPFANVGNMWSFSDESDGGRFFVISSLTSTTLLHSQDDDSLAECSINYQDLLLKDKESNAFAGLGNGWLLQVTADETRVFRRGVLGAVLPGRFGAVAIRQHTICVATQGTEKLSLIDVELRDGQANFRWRQVLDVDDEISCCHIHANGDALFVGTFGAAVNLFQLNADGVFERRSAFNVSGDVVPQSILCIPGTNGLVTAGLRDGILLVLRVDRANGSLHEEYRYKLGTLPVKLTTVDGRYLMAISNDLWRVSFERDQVHCVRVATDGVKSVAFFGRQAGHDLIASIVQGNMRICSLSLEQEVDFTSVQEIRSPRRVLSVGIQGEYLVACDDAAGHSALRLALTKTSDKPKRIRGLDLAEGERIYILQHWKHHDQQFLIIGTGVGRSGRVLVCKYVNQQIDVVRAFPLSSPAVCMTAVPKDALLVGSGVEIYCLYSIDDGDFKSKLVTKVRWRVTCLAARDDGLVAVGCENDGLSLFRFTLPFFHDRVQFHHYCTDNISNVPMDCQFIGKSLCVCVDRLGCIYGVSIPQLPSMDAEPQPIQATLKRAFSFRSGESARKLVLIERFSSDAPKLTGGENGHEVHGDATPGKATLDVVVPTFAGSVYRLRTLPEQDYAVLAELQRRLFAPKGGVARAVLIIDQQALAAASQACTRQQHDDLVNDVARLMERPVAEVAHVLHAYC